MEEDYDPQRESKIIRRLSKMAYGCIVVGGTIMFGGSHYYTTPSMSPELRRYHEIGIVLDNPPKVRSGDLESKSAELIAGINILKAEKDEITSKSDFAEARKRYEFEKEKADSRKDYSFWGGLVLILSSSIPFTLSSRRRRLLCSNFSRGKR